MKALIISNPFKGSLTSKRIGEIVSEELKKQGISSRFIPSTDGGDGFFDAFKYLIPHLTKKDVMVRMPVSFKKHKVSYLFDSRNKTSYISLSDTCGIKYLSENDPLNSNTYGFGEAIKYSIINDKPKIIYLGLGGSASIDMGSGMLEALGTKFYDKDNKLIKDLSNNKLTNINSIDISELKKLTYGIEFRSLLDVNAYIFNGGAVDSYALSKGAKEDELSYIKIGAENYLKCVKNLFDNVCDAPGFGVAGGTSFSLFYFMNSSLVSGSEEFLDLINVDGLFKEYDLVITGEGIVDSQTSQGKLIKSIINHHPKKLVILCAINNSNDIDNVYSIVPNIMSKVESLNNPEEALKKLISSIDFNNI